MIRIEAGDLKFDDDFEDDLLRQAAAQELPRIQATIADLRCPTHGTAARARVREKPKKPGWEIFPDCCKKFQAMVDKRLIDSGLAQEE